MISRTQDVPQLSLSDRTQWETAVCAYKKGDLDSALCVFQRIRNNSMDIMVRINSAIISIRKGDLSGALKHLSIDKISESKCMTNELVILSHWISGFCYIQLQELERAYIDYEVVHQLLVCENMLSVEFVKYGQGTFTIHIFEVLANLLILRNALNDVPSVQELIVISQHIITPRHRAIYDQLSENGFDAPIHGIPADLSLVLPFTAMSDESPLSPASDISVDQNHSISEPDSHLSDKNTLDLYELYNVETSCQGSKLESNLPLEMATGTAFHEKYLANCGRESDSKLPADNSIYSSSRGTINLSGTENKSEALKSAVLINDDRLNFIDSAHESVGQVTAQPPPFSPSSDISMELQNLKRLSAFTNTKDLLDLYDCYNSTDVDRTCASEFVSQSADNNNSSSLTLIPFGTTANTEHSQLAPDSNDSHLLNTFPVADDESTRLLMKFKNSVTLTPRKSSLKHTIIETIMDLPRLDVPYASSDISEMTDIVPKPKESTAQTPSPATPVDSSASRKLSHVPMTMPLTPKSPNHTSHPLALESYFYIRRGSSTALWQKRWCILSVGECGGSAVFKVLKDATFLRPEFVIQLRTETGVRNVEVEPEMIEDCKDLLSAKTYPQDKPLKISEPNISVFKTVNSFRAVNTIVESICAQGTKKIGLAMLYRFKIVILSGHTSESGNDSNFISVGCENERVVLNWISGLAKAARGDARE